jgi:hypothetical protein
MLRVNAKVGTHSQTVIWVLGRVPQKEGDRVKFREGGPEPWRGERTGIFDGTTDMGTYLLWRITRF